MLGFCQEHGPYVMEDETTTFHANEYSWNNFANMLYIESPGGVGFSVCADETDCHFDDDITADDNLVALLDFFENKFPEYQGNDLFVSGESYAGIYVPYVSERIDAYNE
jgi:carboxypeptidase C (cathepsin A)